MHPQPSTQIMDFSQKSSTSEDSSGLHRAVVLWTFAATLIGMGAYTLVEFLIVRPDDWLDFVMHHFLHVAMIGIAVWFATVIVIRRFVLDPMDEIFIHLRRIASGRIEYLDCHVRAREIGDVIASVNDLVAMLRRVPEPDAVSRALDHLQTLRSMLKETSSKYHEDAVPVMRQLTALEGDLLEIVQQTG